MFLPHFEMMAAYNRWANVRLYDSCASLSDASRKQNRHSFFGSIHNTLNHILVGDRAWLDRIEGTNSGGLALDTVLFGDFEDLRRARTAEDDHIDRVIAGMDEERIAADLAYRNLAGARFSTPMRLILSHLFNHHTHHRGQVHGMLSHAGVSPPELDLIYYAHTI